MQKENNKVFLLIIKNEFADASYFLLLQESKIVYTNMFLQIQLQENTKR